MKPPNWTKQEDDLLRQLWADGISGTLIAAAIRPEATRRAIYNRAEVLGLPRRAQQVKEGSARWKRQQRASGLVPKRTKNAKPRPVPAAPIEAPPSFNTYILETTGCKYATAERNGVHLFCNQPGEPYCEYHAGLVRRKPVPAPVAQRNAGIVQAGFQHPLIAPPVHSIAVHSGRHTEGLGASPEQKALPSIILVEA